MLTENKYRLIKLFIANVHCVWAIFEKNDVIIKCILLNENFQVNNLFMSRPS
jgi:hypothetical protein